MVVLIIASIAMSISLPKFAGMRDRMAVRSAKQQLSAYLATARAAAIRQSQTSQFHYASSTIWTTVNQPDGTNINVTRSVPLGTARGVTMTIGGSSVTDSIWFDSRGMGGSTGNLAHTFVLTRNSMKDSVCVSRLGLIARSCGQ
jgi:type II secretory pathway pseudopilin PulG